MTVRLLAACGPGNIRIAAADGCDLLDYAIWRPGARDGVGDLHRGRVEAVLPALGGAFVALETGSGFLPAHDAARRLGKGDAVVVRVSRSAQGGKGPRLCLADDAAAAADRLGPPRLLARGPDPLGLLAAAHPDAPIIADDRCLGADLAPGLRSRIRLADVAIPAEVELQIEALAWPDIALPGGLRASIHPTPALVAIDVDGAAASAARQPKQAAQFAANRAAVGPLLHQIRLRNLSGAILIDLAGLASRKRAALRPEIEAGLAHDPLRPRLIGFTGLGLIEILRPRLHPPLHELLAGPHAAGLAALQQAARAAAAPPHRLPRLVAGIAVAAALEDDAPARQALAARAGQPISIRMDPSLSDLAWKLEHV